MLLQSQHIQDGLRDLAPADSRILYPEGAEFWRKANASPYYEAQVAEIRAEGARLLREPLREPSYAVFAQFARSGKRLEFEQVYFEKRRRLTTFALLSLLEPGNEAYREALHDVIWSVCGEYTWCLPAHLKGTLETDGELAFSLDAEAWGRKQTHTQIDLFAAETGFALSEILSMAGETLPALLRSRMREEIVHRLFKPYLAHGPYHWETAEHNWSAVCAGSIGAAALLVLERSGDVSDIVTKAIGSMECYLRGFGEDGACQEGLGYWNYGFGYFVYFADLLKKRTQGKLDLFEHEKVHRIALFQQKCYLTDDLTANFSDSFEHARVHIGLTHYLAHTYPDMAAAPTALRASYTEDHCARFAPALRNLLWADPNTDAAMWEAADYYLDNAQWLVSRHVAADGRYGFAAKGGHNDEPHNHNDIGQFIVACDGESFVSDLGSGEYTADYFGAERYSYACNGSQGHSVPIINGRFQAAGKQFAAQVVRVSAGEHVCELELDIAHAYPVPQLQELKRRFAWHKNGRLPRLVVEDAYVFTEAPESIVERVVTRTRPQPSDDGGIVIAGGGESRRKLLIRYDRAAVAPNIESHVYSNHFGVETPWYTVDFAVKDPGLVNKVVLHFEFI